MEPELDRRAQSGEVLTPRVRHFWEQRESSRMSAVKLPSYRSSVVAHKRCNGQGMRELLRLGWGGPQGRGD